jgi:DNA-binding NarL/FixJ family response regulator
MGSHRNGRGSIRSIVLDSQPLWQRTLEQMLCRRGVSVVAVCSSAAELAQTAAFHPHLVVGDPGTVSGSAAQLRDLRLVLPGLATIVVSSFDDEKWPQDLAGAGAIGFVRKDCELEAIAGQIAGMIDAEFPLESQLTERELEVLRLVAEGRTNRDVARMLWLSDQTVKFHLANVYRKLGVGSRRDAVARARGDGVLVPQEIRGNEEGEDLAPAALV